MLRARQDAINPDEPEPDEGDFNAYIRNIYRRRRRFSRTTIGLIFVGVLALLLAADAFYSVRRLRTALEEMATSMRAGQAAVVDGDFEKAEGDFVAAQASAERAKALTGRPSLVVGSYLPIIGNDADVLRKLPDVGEAVAAGGRTAIEAARAVGATSKADFARSLYRNGRVNFATLDVGSRYVADALTEFRRARAIIEDLPEPTTSRLKTGLADARLQIDAVLDVIERGDILLQVIPDMMGREAPRRYLVAFQSPSEARATGGFLGLYGVLETVNGRSELVHVGLWDLIEQRAETGGDVGELEALLAAQSNDVVSTINLSPSFEAFSVRLLQVYRRATGNTLDGVLAVDPIALGYLTAATGPLKGEGVAQPIGPDNAVEVILRDSYIQFGRDPLGQTHFLESLIQDFWDTLGSGQVDAPALVNAFGKAGRSKHLKIYSVDADEQAALREFGMDGSFTTAGEDLQFIFHNNLGRNKVDYFLNRSFDTRVRLTRDDYALVTTKIVLRNDAPKTLPVGLGWLDDNTGVNEMDLSVIMPRESIFEELRVNGLPSVPRLKQSNSKPSYPLVTRKLVIPAGKTATVVVSYRVPDAVQLLRGGRFEMTLFPQATVRPDGYSVTIRPPVGFQVEPRIPGGTEIADGGTVFSGTLDEEFRILVDVVPL